MEGKKNLELSADSNESSAEYVAQKIRQDILDGYLSSGDKIREMELSAQLQVSRTPVREAFRVLQSEGFLTYNSGRGVVVAAINAEIAEQTWEVRSILESNAAAKAAQNITPEQLEELIAVQKAMEGLHPFDPHEYTRLDTRLHSLIACASGNAKLEENIHRLWLTSGLTRVFSTYGKKRANASCAEHGRVVHSIQMGDPILAKRYMEIHFSESIKTIVQSLRSEDKSA